MMHQRNFVARNGSWCEQVHELLMTDDEPLFGLAAKFARWTQTYEDGTTKFQFYDQDWTEFVLEAEPNILRSER